MFFPLDGPAKQDKITVTTSSVVEMKADTSVLDERKVILFQPLDGKIYVYFGDGISTPSTSDLSNDGFEYYQGGIYTIEASATQPVFILSASSGSVNVIIAERA